LCVCACTEPYYEWVDLRDNKPAALDAEGSPGKLSPTTAKVSNLAEWPVVAFKGQSSWEIPSK